MSPQAPWSAPHAQSAAPRIALAELPPITTTRWVTRRKAAVVAAVREGVLTLEEACRRYQLLVEEFTSWQRLIDRHGLPGLRATRIQEYRRPATGVRAAECQRQKPEPITPAELDRQKRINAQEACRRNQPSVENFTSGQPSVDRHLPSPRATRIQEFRRPDTGAGAAECPQQKPEPNMPAELDRQKRINALAWNVAARYCR